MHNHNHDHHCSDHHHDHGHSHDHSHLHTSNNEKVVLISFLLTFSFMIVELIGGWISGSLALIADAGHMLTDASALALAWAGFYFGRRKFDSKKTFGYFRFEVLAALLNAITLFALTIWIGYEAYQRFHQPAEIMALPMLSVAIIGLLVNCIVFYILTRGDKEHLNIKSAILHVLGDLLGSIGAIVAAIIIYFTGWTPIDSILSIFVCLLILKSTWSVLKNAINILMEGTPAGIDIREIKKHLATLPNVVEIDHIHVWAITSGKVLATMNVAVGDQSLSVKTIKRIKTELAKKFNIMHSTIEIGSAQCSFTPEPENHKD